MGELILFVISLYIKAYVQSIIIRNPELISVPKQNKLGIIKYEIPYRYSNRSSGLINEVSRETVTIRQLKISHKTEVMRLVEIGWKEISVIHAFLREFTIQSYK